MQVVHCTRAWGIEGKLGLESIEYAQAMSGWLCRPWKGLIHPERGDILHYTHLEGTSLALTLVPYVLTESL